MSKAHQPEVAPERLGDLVQLLHLTGEQYGRLGDVIRAKLTTMRNADLPAMRRLMDEEITLAQKLHEREGLRKQLMDLIGGELGLPPKQARALPVSQLAARLPRAAASELVAAADRLRAEVTNVAQANRMVAVVARELWNHLRWVLASVRPQGDVPIGYSAGGSLVSLDGTMIFEAIG